MSVNNIFNSLPPQFVRQPSKPTLSEKANAIYAKLNEDEQSFLDKETVEKALDTFSGVQTEPFFLEKKEQDTKAIYNTSINNQYELASELAIRMQANNRQVKQQPVMNLTVDDAGVLVSAKVKTDKDNTQQQTEAAAIDTNKRYEQKNHSDEFVQHHISITA